MVNPTQAGHNGSTRSAIAAVTAQFQSPGLAAHLARLAACLPLHARLLVVGGALRNIIMRHIHGTAPPTRDIDVIIDGLSPDFSLASALAAEHTTATDLGGIRWQPDQTTPAWDLCLLPAFVVIRRFHLMPDRRTLLENIDFNVNAVIYEPATRQFEERGCISGIRRRELDFNTTRRVDALLSLYRILLIGYKTGFVLSRRLFAFVHNPAEPETLLRLRRLLVAKQGKSTSDILMWEYNRVATAADYDAYLRKCRQAM